ncbi:MAG: ABC transporter substrate-binding protein [Anaerolineales bacterium]|nr:ABC transporter substrate-binding protein [Anaerolineales bacterium]
MPKRVLALTLLAGLLAACAPVAVQLPGTPPIADTLSPQAATEEPQATETAGPSPTPLPDYGGEQITLLHFCARGGPFGVAYAGQVRAVEEQVEAINAVGGVLGAELALAFADTSGDAEEAQTAASRLLRQNSAAFLALVCDPASEITLAESLGDANVFAIGPGVAQGASLFPLEPAPQAQLEFALDALLAEWLDLRPSGAGFELRLALLTWPEELAGELAWEPDPTDPPEAEDLDPPSGGPFASLVLQAEMEADLAANVHDFIYAARDANANAIYTNLRGFGLAHLLNALHDLGLRERFVVVTPALGYDLQVYEYLADPARAQGLYLTSAWAWWGESGNPGVEALLAAGAADDFPDWGALRAAGAVDLARHALQQTMLSVGYERLNYTTLARTMRNLPEYAVLDGLTLVGSDAAAQLRLWQVHGELGELQLVHPSSE